GGGRVHVCGTSISNVKFCQNRQTGLKRFNSCFQFPFWICPPVFRSYLFIYLWFNHSNHLVLVTTSTTFTTIPSVQRDRRRSDPVVRFKAMWVNSICVIWYRGRSHFRGDGRTRWSHVKNHSFG
ncbi:hypothetical protein VIGAN_08263600, partial [Vigna angularis var. angularis]